MSSKKVKEYSAEFKFKVVMELLNKAGKYADRDFAEVWNLDLYA